MNWKYEILHIYICGKVEQFEISLKFGESKYSTCILRLKSCRQSLNDNMILLMQSIKSVTKISNIVT